MAKKCEKVDNYCREEKMGCEGCANDTNVIVAVGPKVIARISSLKPTGMAINTKYQIGQKIWVVDANKDNKVVEVYSDIIDGIFIDSKGDIYYYLADICDDIIESKIIPFGDIDTLNKTIIEADSEINIKEGE